MSPRILVVDDEIGMQIALREVFQRQGHKVTVTGDGGAALGHLEAGAFDLVVCDVRMPEMSGLELLDHIHRRWPRLPVVIMTAYGTIEDAVDAMKKGACDYLLKPFSSETIEDMVRHRLRRREAKADEQDEAADGADYGGGRSGADPIAISRSMQHVLELSREVADSTATILIQGQSGTGKEIVARYIHLHSGRKSRAFIAINCAALPEGLLESELFGHEKGAFTGAILARKGKFQLAHRGTLLLDEISEMPLTLQAKLLRVLQEREIDPIGSQRTVSLDVRVIATTNRNLAAYVDEGNFREDLFYRLQVITIEIPPLRHRREDILPLSEFFVRRHCRMNRRPRKRLSDTMRNFLLEQSWRGNVRELENFLERAVLLCKQEEISPDNIFLPNWEGRSVGAAPERTISMAAKGAPVCQSGPLSTVGAASPVEGWDSSLTVRPGEQLTLEEMERRLILQTLDRVGGNRTRAADILEVSVRTIRNKLAQYGLNQYGLAPMASRPAADSKAASQAVNAS